MEDRIISANLMMEDQAVELSLRPRFFWRSISAKAKPRKI